AYVWIPRNGTPTALVHAIDAELWSGWPAEWRKIVWIRREELKPQLAALVGGKAVAMEHSPEGAVPYGDYVPGGTLELVRSAGARVLSSAELVTRCCSVWSPDDLASHMRAAAIISEIAQAAIARAGERARSTPVTEHELTQAVLAGFDSAGLVTESAPSVSYGAHAARAHYEATPEGSAAIVPGA